MPTTSHLDTLLTARMGGANAFEAMQRACQELVDQLGPPRLPVRLAPLARVMGAALDYEDRPGIGREEAAIQFKDGRLILWVSKSHFEDVRTRRRARFSIAHELGHLLMFKMLGPEFLDHTEANDGSYVLAERLCDFAASQILMPRNMLNAAVRERPFTSFGLRSLADLFGVSSQALLKAIADLVPDGAVIELRKFQRQSAEALTWRVWAVSTASASTDLRSWLPPGCTLKHIRGLPPPETVPAAAAFITRGLTLVRGRTLGQRDAVVTRILGGNASSPNLLAHEGTRLRASTMVQDHEVGRVLMLAAQCGSLEALWPGLTTAGL